MREETFTIVMKAFLTSVSKNVVPFMGIITMQNQSSSVNSFQSSSGSQPFGFLYDGHFDILILVSLLSIFPNVSCVPNEPLGNSILDVYLPV